MVDLGCLGGCCSRGRICPNPTISSYEHILLAPFKGTGQFCPSLGWTWLVAHGVPVKDNDDMMFRPEVLLTEVHTLPGLKRAYFAMKPRWVKPVDDINSAYSSITFAISDPDGSILSSLLKGRVALFGKEVNIKKWVEKPVLVQCSRCHALGHNKTSRACLLGPSLVRCYICGGAHKLEEHDQHCPHKHAVAGKCDCTNYLCLNCSKQGHNCRDWVCPSCDLYHPCNTKQREISKDKGKGWDPAEGPGLPPSSRAEGTNNALGADSHAGPQTCSITRRRSDTATLQGVITEISDDDETPFTRAPITNTFTFRTYSPLLPQFGAAAPSS